MSTTQQTKNAAYTVNLVHVTLRFVPEHSLELVNVKTALAELCIALETPIKVRLDTARYIAMSTQ